MVSGKVVSRFTGPLPASPDGDRSIPGGPLYPAADVLALLEAGAGAVRVWTRKCTADVQQLALDADELVTLLREAITAGRFAGAQWCRQNPSGPWAACDAYALTRRERLHAAGRELSVDYYLKFALAKTGTLLLLVSCHLSS